MLQRFIRSPEFAEFSEFLFHLGKMLTMQCFFLQCFFFAGTKHDFRFCVYFPCTNVSEGLLVSVVQPELQVFDMESVKAVHHFVDDDYLNGVIELCGKTLNGEIFLSFSSLAKVNLALLHVCFTLIKWQESRCTPVTRKSTLDFSTCINYTDQESISYPHS